MTHRAAQARARARSLAAARDLFFRQGFEESSMEAIARAAGYTRRTLYAHFRSREEICLIVFMEGLKARWERQRARMAAAGTGLQEVRAWGEGLHAFAREHPSDLRLQSFWDYRGIDRSAIRPSVFRRFRLLNEEIVAGLRAAFERGKADGTVRSDLPVDLTINQYALTLRAVLNKALFPGYSFSPVEADIAATHFLDLFVRSIGCSQPNEARPDAVRRTSTEV